MFAIQNLQEFLPSPVNLRAELGGHLDNPLEFACGGRGNAHAQHSRVPIEQCDAGPFHLECQHLEMMEGPGDRGQLDLEPREIAVVPGGWRPIGKQSGKRLYPGRVIALVIDGTQEEASQFDIERRDSGPEGRHV